jgi:hypothetical protein
MKSIPVVKHLETEFSGFLAFQPMALKSISLHISLFVPFPPGFLNASITC